MIARDVADRMRERYGARYLADDPGGPPASMTSGA
jgi:hypothetical protein